jgi:hypothetical protein
MPDSPAHKNLLRLHESVLTEGSSYALPYQIAITVDNGRWTPSGWSPKDKGPNVRTADGLRQWVKDAEDSTMPGGVNSHIGPTKILKAVVSRSNGTVVQTYERPKFVVGEAAYDPKSSTGVNCPDCKGAGEDERGRECENCVGTGKLSKDQVKDLKESVMNTQSASKQIFEAITRGDQQAAQKAFARTMAERASVAIQNLQRTIAQSLNRKTE